MPNFVYGYAVVDSEGKPAPLNRRCYDTKNAAANGFNQWTKRSYNRSYFEKHGLTEGVKLKDQSVFEVIELVGNV